MASAQLLLITVLYALLSANGCKAATAANDVRILSAFYEGRITDWLQDDGWSDDDSEDPCGDAWFGVTCVGNRVTEFVANLQELSRRLPLNSVDSPASVLGGLSALQFLDLSGNRYINELPEELSHISTLMFLDLSDNDFDGEIPSSWASLPFSDLVLSGNSLQGLLPEFLQNPPLFNVDLSDNLLQCPYNGWCDSTACLSCVDMCGSQDNDSDGTFQNCDCDDFASRIVTGGAPTAGCVASLAIEIGNIPVEGPIVLNITDVSDGSSSGDCLPSETRVSPTEITCNGLPFLVPPRPAPPNQIPVVLTVTDLYPYGVSASCITYANLTDSVRPILYPANGVMMDGSDWYVITNVDDDGELELDLDDLVEVLECSSFDFQIIPKEFDCSDVGTATNVTVLVIDAFSNTNVQNVTVYISDEWNRCGPEPVSMCTNSSECPPPRGVCVTFDGTCINNICQYTADDDICFDMNDCTIDRCELEDETAFYECEYEIVDSPECEGTLSQAPSPDVDFPDGYTYFFYNYFFGDSDESSSDSFLSYYNGFSIDLPSHNYDFDFLFYYFDNYFTFEKLDSLQNGALNRLMSELEDFATYYNEGPFQEDPEVAAAFRDFDDLIDGEDALRPSQYTPSVVESLADSALTLARSAQKLTSSDRRELAQSIRSLSQTVSRNPVLYDDSVGDGSLQDILLSASTLLQTELDLDNNNRRKREIDETDQSVAREALKSLNDIAENGYKGVRSRDGAMLPTDAFNLDIQRVSIRTPGKKRDTNGNRVSLSPRQPTDECDSSINAADLFRLLEEDELTPRVNLTRGRDLSSSGIQYNSLDAFTALDPSTTLQSGAQGVSLYWLDGEKVDIGNRGVQVAVPINGHLWERLLREGRKPKCVFFNYTTERWDSSGVDFDHCDFGALLTGSGGGGGNGNSGDIGSQFEDPEFATIFAVSWFLILLVVVIGLLVIVAAYKVPAVKRLIIRPRQSGHVRRMKSQRREIEMQPELDTSFSTSQHNDQNTIV